jgi:hypothetical protein
MPVYMKDALEAINSNCIEMLACKYIFKALEYLEISSRATS